MPPRKMTTIPDDLSERPSVLEVLEKAPAMLAYLATIVVQKRKEFDMAKTKLKVAQAKATIKHSNERNQEIIKAYRDDDEVVKQAEEQVIEAQAAWKIAEIEHEKIYNHFISARKIGGMDDPELHALAGARIKGGIVTDEQGRKVDSDTGEIME